MSASRGTFALLSSAHNLLPEGSGVNQREVSNTQQQRQTWPNSKIKRHSLWETKQNKTILVKWGTSERMLNSVLAAPKAHRLLNQERIPSHTEPHRTCSFRTCPTCQSCRDGSEVKCQSCPFREFQFPVSTSRGSQLPGTQLQAGPTPPSGFCGHPHSHCT